MRTSDVRPDVPPNRDSLSRRLSIAVKSKLPLDRIGPLNSSRCLIWLSPLAYRLCWLLTLSIHGTLAWHFLNVVQLHVYLSQDGLLYFPNYVGDNVVTFFPAVIVANLILCACHVFTFLIAIAWSVYYRALVFGRRPHIPNVEPATPWSPRIDRCTKCFERTVNFFFGRRGFFGVENNHFLIVYISREVVEIMFQTYQAYKLSSYITSIWINRCFCILIVLNCWSTPLVHHVWKKPEQESARKVACLVLDVILDITSACLIPAIIFWPYVREFDASYQDFPLVDYYQDTWFLKAVSENQQLFVTSWLDFVSKMFPAVSILSTMRSLKRSIARKSATVSPTHRSADTYSTATGIVHRVLDSTAVLTITTTVMGWRHRDWRQWHGKLTLHKVVDMLFILWGAGVAALHLHSSSVAWTSNTDGCLLEMRPWLTLRNSCVVAEISCGWRYDITGRAPEIHSIWKEFDTSHLRSIILSSCPSLEIPASIKTFEALEIVKIYNSTIVEWGADASLTRTEHPNMQFVYILETAMAEIPVGLLSDDFPPSLTDVEFSGSNLSSVPNNLDEKWPFVDYFVLESSPGIREFPEPLRRMNIRHLSLCGDGISALPDDYFVNQTLHIIDLTGNPITRLPDTMVGGTALSNINAAFTNLSTIPTWILELAEEPSSWPDLTLAAGGSPVCTNYSADTPTSLTPLSWLDCSVSDDTIPWTLYPVEAEREWREATHADK